MKLGRIRIAGYRKLVDTECSTTGKLLAIVGPNEAGKSTLLDALLATRNAEPIPPLARPRGMPVEDNETAVELWFRLDQDDLAALQDVESPDRPVWLVLWKLYGEGLHVRIEPTIGRDHAARREAERALARFATVRAAHELERTEDGTGPGNLLDAVISALAGEAEVEVEVREQAAALAELLQHEATGALGTRAAVALATWLAGWREEHPASTARKLLNARRPIFAKFGQAERILASAYDLTEVAEDPPAALRNLCIIGDLDLDALAKAVADQDVGAYVSAIEDANDVLREVFREAYKQAVVTVRLQIDGTTLRVLVSNESGGYSTIAERSDGLKSFVALTAFAAQESRGKRPLILLIDEAEQHLHYDAQADLIRMLERQGQAQQVIYTTHSAGCLPADLGTGIRPVVPEAGGGRSRVVNAFWTEGRGFQPLLLALGAGAAAFTPSRYAVLTEGASDMLLLPSMLREAAGRERLDYQVAPGIAEASWTQLLGLELEAPRVAYLVDGDAGGNEHAKRLLTASVDAVRIITLGGVGSGLTTEDLLREDVYLQAINELIERVHGPSHGRMKVSDLATPNRAKSVERWCAAHGLTPLAKPAVASLVLEQAPPALLTSASKSVLRVAHRNLCSALGIPA
jgi:predicted ATP-dependent endonuclease of OLD family